MQAGERGARKANQLRVPTNRHRGIPQSDPMKGFVKKSNMEGKDVCLGFCAVVG